ncbi:hypothetical protein E2C01_025237 [Portunus trituberculatus]|uniref:Uncharacterized protein n=1 Tax=Portunus trituberculatus TaxID=210409 RepID=A0A5B7EF21_PORTR|nr:hypothetical protein [Portunus trituberculatus]
MKRHIGNAWAVLCRRVDAGWLWRSSMGGTPLPSILTVNQSYVPIEGVRCGNSRVATDETASRERVGLCWVRSERREGRGRARRVRVT